MRSTCTSRWEEPEDWGVRGGKGAESLVSRQWRGGAKNACVPVAGAAASMPSVLRAHQSPVLAPSFLPARLLSLQRGLFERHKLLFALMLANKVLVSSGRVRSSDLDVFLKGGGALDISSVRKKPKVRGEGAEGRGVSRVCVCVCGKGGVTLGLVGGDGVWGCWGACWVCSLASPHSTCHKPHLTQLHHLLPALLKTCRSGSLTRCGCLWWR